MTAVAAEVHTKTATIVTTVKAQAILDVVDAKAQVLTSIKKALLP